ncbi:MAG: SUMF1/EgtB/PvdO family nonheme iron enzyme [Rhodanobacter sp.]
MPKNALLRHQRTAGGVLGVLVLAFALTYHFFPRLLHVDPAKAPHHALTLGSFAPPSSVSSRLASAAAEINAGPPLTLAPTAVIARFVGGTTNLPEQHTEDSAVVRALLERASKALHAGHLVGDKDSAATLFDQALKQQPDSRRAAQGLLDVRARLVAEADHDLAMGDEHSASDMLDALRTLPNTANEVAQLEGKLKILVKVRPMLAKAASLVQEGNADKPAGNSALDLYRDVQMLDPTNAVAEQGLLNVQHVVLDRALAALAQNDFPAADKALAEAAQVSPDSQQLQDTRARVGTMREQRALGFLAQARSALDGGNVALASKLADQARATSPQLEALAEFDLRLTNARLYENFRPGQVFADRFVDMAGSAPAMVVIPTGTFSMGSPASSGGRSAEVPQHIVTVSQGFAMGRTDVSVGQFRQFVRASNYVPDSVKLGGGSVYDERSGALRAEPRASWESDYVGNKAGDNLPVINVSWNDATAYAHWLSERAGKIYRLPSEAEFEYALRAGTTTRYWWGDGPPKARVENLTGAEDKSPQGRRWSHAFKGYGDGYWGPAPVMSFAANPFGLYDMNGNVSAWVADCWHDNYVHAPADGSAWLNPGCTTRVVRGGSWGSSPEQVNSAFRQGVNSDVRSARVGFRVVRELGADK